MTRVLAAVLVIGLVVVAVVDVIDDAILPTVKCPELHYTNTGYGHLYTTPPTDKLTTILQLVVNKFTTNGQKFTTSQHLDMSRCWALALRCGKFVVQHVVELL